MNQQRKRSDAEAHALVVAGRLLQGSGVKIQCQEGERYPDAVLRALNALPGPAVADLRDQVRWVLDYERAEQH